MITVFNHQLVWDLHSKFMIKRLIFFVLAVSLSSQIMAGERGFAIIVDNNTYKACKSDIDSYVSTLKGEGFTTWLLAKEWKTPEEVRDNIKELYKQGLEGAVFIGQIPVAMIRDAQYFTSAFKMDQKAFSMLESSVPSDRFYDDFDLKFDFIAKDSTKTLFYYYSLRWDSPQRICCDIYTGRIKPTRSGEAGYQQIRDYFKKLIVERQSGNAMDVLVSYTGEGSFSNSLTAWKDEGVTLREQFPQAFTNRNSAKFLMFYNYPYMKQTITEELQRDDVDLMLFHEHGMPYRQYITGVPKSEGSDSNIEAAKRLFREKLRKLGKDNPEAFGYKKGWMNYYHIDSTWFTGQGLQYLYCGRKCRCDHYCRVRDT